MKLRKAVLVGILISVMVIFMGVPAQASLSLVWEGNFTSDHLTGGYGSAGPFGTVQIYQDGSPNTFDIVVTLNNSNSKFVRTGAGDGFNFKFGTTNPGSNIITGFNSNTPGNLVYSYAGALGVYNGDGGGNYYYGVVVDGQGTGGGSGISGPLDFTIIGNSNLTLAWLTAPNNLNQIFVADVISGINGNTGLIDVSSAVPIPAAVWLLGTGLLGLLGIRRKIG